MCKNGWTDWDVISYVDSGRSKEALLNGGAQWRHLANTAEPSMCGVDAAFMSNYFDPLLLLHRQANLMVILRWTADSAVWTKYILTPVLAEWNFIFDCQFYIVTFSVSGKGRDVPSIYAVESTSEEDWETSVRLPSSKLISSFLQVCLSLQWNSGNIFILIIRYNQATGYASQHIWCLSQARINFVAGRASGVKMGEWWRWIAD